MQGQKVWAGGEWMQVGDGVSSPYTGRYFLSLHKKLSLRGEEGCAFRNVHGATEGKWKNIGSKLSCSMDMQGLIIIEGLAELERGQGAAKTVNTESI